VWGSFPHQDAFRYTQLDYTRTYFEFRNDVDTFARALIAMVVKQGEPMWPSGQTISRMVQSLLGRHEDRRGACHRQHRL
jgi:hypothetical protein